MLLETLNTFIVANVLFVTSNSMVGLLIVITPPIRTVPFMSLLKGRGESAPTFTYGSPSTTEKDISPFAKLLFNLLKPGNRRKEKRIA